MKVCKACGQRKPLLAYYRHNQTADGYLHQCKSCVCQRIARNAKAWQELAPEVWRYSRTATGRKWRNANRDKAKAHQDVRRALRQGVLVRESCADCGTAHTQAHHEDYSNPLAVTWLCHNCHARRHSLAREKRKAA